MCSDAHVPRRARVGAARLPGRTATRGLATHIRRLSTICAVIGITDIQLAHQMRPALTTVSIQTEAVAELSIRSLILIRLIDQPDRQPPMVLGPQPELVVRMPRGHAGGAHAPRRRQRTHDLRFARPRRRPPQPDRCTSRGCSLLTTARARQARAQRGQ
ncbi:MAG: substrate-binding domain-containing protein [Paraburkholderia sp.]|nr:substrate-binding domain-containing protein [Paraburkholderia sp.]